MLSSFDLLLRLSLCYETHYAAQDGLNFLNGGLKDIRYYTCLAFLFFWRVILKVFLSQRNGLYHTRHIHIFSKGLFCFYSLVENFPAKTTH